MAEQGFDIVIVGSGAGGLAAAITATLQGLKPLLLEKTDLIGGSTSISGGILWLPDNPLLRRDGVADSREAALTYLANFVEEGDPASTPARREAFVDGVAPMVAMMETQGMKYQRCEGYSDYYSHLPGGHSAGRSLQADLFNANRLGVWKKRLRAPQIALPVRTGEGSTLTQFGFTLKGKAMAARVAGRFLGAKLTGRTIYGSGGALQGRMLEIALRRGVEIWTEAAFTGFDTQDGRVTGVHVTHEGREKVIAAPRGVIMTAGGFARNAEMRQEHQKAPVSADWTHANPGDTGDAIQAMAGLGAALGHMDESWWVMGFPADDVVYQLVPELMKPHGMLVGVDGKRFVNEARSYMELGRACYARNAVTKAIPAWLVMDSEARKRYLFGFQPPGKLPKRWIDTGAIQVADTIGELAAKCGIDVDGLESEVARFNGFCATGVDLDFHKGDNDYAHYWGDPTSKPNPNLGTIARPPFWAAPITPSDVGTAGGVITDEHARVLRADGTVIEGLYAAGNCAAPFAGKHYIGAGQSIGASSVFGYLATLHAAAN